MREWVSGDGRIVIKNCDCVEYMRGLPDKFFSLALVDPPYGIGMDGGNVGYKGFNNFEKKGWDVAAPSVEYFQQLLRVSTNQVIWGGNYFVLPPSRCWIVWDKGEGFENRTFAECELAWTSFDMNVRKFKHDPLAKGDYRGKINPCQKPVALYRWLLHNYAKEGDRILDTHGGSMSSVCACHEKGFEVTCCELDADYYEAGLARVQKAMQQQTLDLGV